MSTATDPPVDGSFQRALAVEMDRMREAYAEHLALPNYLIDILHYKNGWPVRFHLFPRFGRAKWVWRVWTLDRIPTAIEVLRGKHECGN